MAASSFHEVPYKEGGERDWSRGVGGGSWLFRPMHQIYDLR